MVEKKFEKIPRRNYGCERRRLLGLSQLVSQGKKLEFEACLVARDLKTFQRAESISSKINVEYHVSFDIVSNEVIIRYNAIRDRKLKEKVLLMLKNSILNDCDPFDPSKPLDRWGITKRRLDAIINYCNAPVGHVVSPKAVSEA